MIGVIILGCVFGVCVGLFITMLIIPIVVYEKSHRENKQKDLNKIKK